MVLIFTGLILCSFVSVGLSDGFGPGSQKWGHTKVREGAYMFWWLYLTTADVESKYDRPLVIWLQGGPGASSTGYGNFEEIGPLDMDLEQRNNSWVNDMNVLFIDNPVGSGFSYVDSRGSFARTNTQIAEDLLNFLKQFYKRFPLFQSVPLHIFSQSYGGKMAVEFAYLVDQERKHQRIESNLKSVALLGPWISPIDSVMSYAPFLKNLGFVDNEGYLQIKKGAERTKEKFNSGKFIESTNEWRITENIISDLTKGIDFYNVLLPIREHGSHEATTSKIITNIMEKVQVKLNLTESRKWGAQKAQTFRFLINDFMKPVSHFVELLLNQTSIDVTVINGQLDLIVPAIGTMKWVDKLKWPGKDDYENASRGFLMVDGIVEGYKKEFGKLKMYWVNRAGHVIPADNPKAMGQILKDVTKYSHGYK